MKKLPGIMVFLLLSFVFLFVCSAEIVYFTSEGNQVSAIEYEKIARDWQANVSEINKSRGDETAPAENETTRLEQVGSDLADPVVVRKKRLEQWKKYRELHSS